MATSRSFGLDSVFGAPQAKTGLGRLAYAFAAGPGLAAQAQQDEGDKLAEAFLHQQQGQAAAADAAIKQNVLANRNTAADHAKTLIDNHFLPQGMDPSAITGLALASENPNFGDYLTKVLEIARGNSAVSDYDSGNTGRSNLNLALAGRPPIDYTKESGGVAFDPNTRPGQGPMMVTPVGSADIAAKAANAWQSKASGTAALENAAVARNRLSWDQGKPVVMGADSTMVDPNTHQPLYTAPKQEPGDGGPFSGKSLEAQAWNILLNGKYGPNTPQYAAAYNSIYGKPYYTQTDQGLVPVMRQPPPNLPKPTWNGGSVAPDSPTPSGEPGAPAVAPAPVPGDVLPGTQSKSKMSATDAGKVAMLNQGTQNIAKLRPMIFGPDGSGYNRTLATEMGNKPLSLLNGDARTARALILNAVEARLRAESGAAVPQPEVERAAERFIPGAFDSPESARVKINNLDQYLQSASGLVEQGYGGNAPAGVGKTATITNPFNGGGAAAGTPNTALVTQLQGRPENQIRNMLRDHLSRNPGSLQNPDFIATLRALNIDPATVR